MYTDTIHNIFTSLLWLMSCSGSRHNFFFFFFFFLIILFWVILICCESFVRLVVAIKELFKLAITLAYTITHSFHVPHLTHQASTANRNKSSEEASQKGVCQEENKQVAYINHWVHSKRERQNDLPRMRKIMLNGHCLCVTCELIYLTLRHKRLKKKKNENR